MRTGSRCNSIRLLLVLTLTCIVLLVLIPRTLYCDECNTKHEERRFQPQYHVKHPDRLVPSTSEAMSNRSALVKVSKQAVLLKTNITASINVTMHPDSYTQDAITDANVLPCPSTTVQLVVSVDMDQLAALLPLLQSIKAHNNKGHTRIDIHIVVSTGNKPSIERHVLCAINMPSNIKIQFITFDVPDSFRRLIKVESHEYLSSTANFARFFFAELFPSLSHILYIDVDTIVKCNISKLWSEVIQADEELLVVVPRKSPNYSMHFPYQNITDLFYARYNRELDLDSDSFNAGVAGFNLNKWRRNKLSEEVLYWMKENYKSPLWFQGTQPVLFIVAYQDWKGVDKCWNVNGLGWTRVPIDAVRNGCILHWTGSEKPWNKMKVLQKARHWWKGIGQHNDLWKKYNTNKEECSKRGVCGYQNATESGTGGRIGCVCDAGYYGQLCERTYIH